MDRLFASGRGSYVGKKREPGSCPFCAAVITSDDAAAYIVERTPDFLVLLNRYPYNAGHLLVVPVAHVADLVSLRPPVRAALMEAVVMWAVRVERALGCHGFNIGCNLGQGSGGSIPEHVHLHVVPRWQGDTNFLVTTADTKLVSVGLAEVYEKIMKAGIAKGIAVENE